MCYSSHLFEGFTALLKKKETTVYVWDLLCHTVWGRWYALGDEQKHFHGTSKHKKSMDI